MKNKNFKIKAAFAILFLLGNGLFTNNCFASDPFPWWCLWPVTYTRVTTFTQTGSSYTYTNDIGTAEGAGPQTITLLDRETESVTASASCTLGINETVVCQGTLGVSAGWSVMIGSAHAFPVPDGEYWLCHLDEKVFHSSGNVSWHDYGTGAFCGCDGIYYSHYHYGTYTSLKHAGTRGRHDVL